MASPTMHAPVDDAKDGFGIGSEDLFGGIRSCRPSLILLASRGIPGAGICLPTPRSPWGRWTATRSTRQNDLSMIWLADIERFGLTLAIGKGTRDESGSKSDILSEKSEVPTVQTAKCRCGPVVTKKASLTAKSWSEVSQVA